MKEYTIDSPYIKNLLEELGFERYPYNMIGILMWLRSYYEVVVTAYPYKNGFGWYGIEENTREETGEDFTEYSTLEEALEAGLVETICYLSLKNKPKKYYGDDDSRPE